MIGVGIDGQARRCSALLESVDHFKVPARVDGVVMVAVKCPDGDRLRITGFLGVSEGCYGRQGGKMLGMGRAPFLGRNSAKAEAGQIDPGGIDPEGLHRMIEDRFERRNRPIFADRVGLFG